jgi:hypothetical protein
MKPLQVYLDDAEHARLASWARRHGFTKSQAVRAALRALTGKGDEDPLLAASGMIEGLPADGAERFDHYLHRTYVAERPPAHRSARRRRAAGVHR